jgi:hypothetical protein
VKSSYRNVAFRVPKTPLSGFPQAFESIRWEIGGAGVPETLVLGTLTPVGRPEQMQEETQRCGDPTFARLTRAREYTRRMGEQGELRGSRRAGVADFFKRYPH